MQMIRTSSFVDYARMCASEAAAKADAVPVFSGAGDHDTTLLAGFLKDSWQELSWREQASRIMQIRSSRTNIDLLRADIRHPTATLLVRDGPCCIPAALLAAHLSWELKIAPGALSEAETFEESPYVFLGLPTDFSDQLLWHEQYRLYDALTLSKPWRQLPRWTMLCGRDLSAITWIVWKWIEDRVALNTGVTSHRLMSVTPNDSTTFVWSELKISGGTSDLIHREGDAQAFLSNLRSPHDLVAIPTHGFEACADGGGGIVLCGRHEKTDLPEGTLGVLACGRGYPCPRGPQPIALREFASKFMILGSCNGLRLGDSVLHPDFNLGLSFVDGNGLAYVSSLFSATGNDAAVTVFGAALASGFDLGEASLFLNSFLFKSHLDFPPYVTNGPLSALLSSKKHGDNSTLEWIGDNPLSIEADAHCIEIILSNSPHFEQPSPTDLVLRFLGLDRQEPIYWFAYSDPEVGIRIFVFSFPTTLRGSLLQLGSLSELEHDARESFQGVSQWLDFYKLAGIYTNSIEVLSQIKIAHDDAEQTLVTGLRCCRYEAIAAETVRTQTAALLNIGSILSSLALDLLCDALFKPFWLSNIFSPTLRTQFIGTCFCPNCNGNAVERHLDHPIVNNPRICIVCPRCGIVWDGVLNGLVKSMIIIAPEIVRRGERWKLQIVLELRKATQQIVYVAPRLSANGWCSEAPIPDRIEFAPSDDLLRSAELWYVTPSDVPPHRYFLKALTVTALELCFSSRVILVE